MQESVEAIARVGVIAGVAAGMLGLGLGLTVGEIVEPLRNRRAVALALLANFVFVPLLALLLARILPLSLAGKTAIVLLGIGAGAPFLPKLAELCHGAVPYAVGLMALLMILSVGYVPLVLPRLLPGVSVEPAEIARSLLVLLLLPLAVGLFARARYPRTAHWGIELGRLGGAALLIGLGAGLLADWRDLVSVVGSWILIAAVLLTLGSATIGWLVATGAAPERQRVAALSTASRNVSAALLVAGTDFGGETLALTMAASLMLIVAAVVTAGELGRGVGLGKMEKGG